MSKTPRNKATGETQPSRFHNTLETFKGIREKTTGPEGYLTKELEAHTESMVRIIKKHFNKNDRETTSDTIKSKAQPVSKMYTNVYNGVYRGVIDGLAKSKENERLLKLEEERKQNQKQFAKSMGRSLLSFPNTIRRGLINVFAFERSEILQTYRAIRHSVGVDKEGKAGYEQRLFRLMLEDRSKKQGSLTPNLLGQMSLEAQERQIELLTAIRDNSASSMERENRLAQFILGNKDSPEVEQLKDIELNTSGRTKQDIFIQQKLIKWGPLFAALTPAAIGSAMGATLATTFSPLFASVGLLGAWLGGRWAKFQRSQEVQQTILQEKLVKQGEENDPIKIFGIGKKRTDSTNNILKDIRTELSPKQQKKYSLWDKITKVPLSELFNTQKKETESVADKQLTALGEIKEEIEYNSDWTEMTYHLLAGGIGVRPLISGAFTIFEAQNLKNLEQIEDANLEEISAIESLKQGICACLGSGRADDYKDSLKADIGLEERERENREIVTAIRDNTADIYQFLLSQATGTDGIPDTGIVDTAKGMLQIAGDASEVLQGTKDLKDMVFGRGKKGDIVTLSDATMNRFEDILDDDGPLDMLKKRRKGGKQIKGNFPTRNKDIIPDKSMAKKGFGSKLKGLLGKGKVLGGAALGSAGLVAAAGAAGYGIGTLLNKGIDAGMGMLTGGENKSLGGWLYDITHKKEIEAEKAQTEKLKKLQAEKAVEKASSAKVLAKEKENIVDKEFKANDKQQKEELSRIQNELNNVGKDSSGSINSVIAKGAAGATLAKGIAGEIISKARGLEISNALTAIFDRSESARMELMSDMKEALDTAKSVAGRSETAQALGETINDVKNVVTGATTNISVPVNAHDTDRSTNVLNKVYSS